MKRFKDKNAEAIFSGKTVKKLPHDVQRRALLRVNRIVTTATLEDLSQPPSHRLKALQGDRKGQHSIRINDQYRVCFIWDNGMAWEIEITDYH